MTHRVNQPVSPAAVGPQRRGGGFPARLIGYGLETRSPARRRGFTMAELIVAVGVTLILILGVGRIFTTTRDTISTGEATARLNESARTIERLLRQDFAGITRDGFLVIRNESIGQRGNDSDDPRGIRGNRRGNLREAIYLNQDAEDAGQSLVTDDDPVLRLDQIVFFAEGEFASYQYRNKPFGQANIIARNETAPVARVWWGHGLRDPQSEDTLDGIKSDPGLDGYAARFADDRPRDRRDNANYYAGDWVLARQPALLLTRQAAGCDTDDNDADLELNFAPSFIEIYNEFDQPPGQGPYWYDEDYFYPAPYNATAIERRLSAGYVDLIDMDLMGVMKAVTEYGRLYNRTNGTTDAVPDPLSDLYSALCPGQTGRDWSLDARTIDDGGLDVRPYVTDQRDLDDLYGLTINETWLAQQRLRMMYATGRIRVETAAPSADRAAQMLTHATLVSGCSRFEVAWSAGELSYPEGELVWYDIDNPANPYAAHPGKTNREVDAQTPRDTELWYLSEILPPLRSGLNDPVHTTTPPVEPEYQDAYYAVFGDFVPKDIENDDVDDRGTSWPWPELVRVRLTLHDPEGRIPEGRTFEYTFSLPQR